MENYQKDFNWDAHDYARNASAQYRWASELIDKLHLRGDERLLDIGCGDGRITVELATRLGKGQVVGIDASENMIEAAQQGYPASSYPNLTFCQMDARRINCNERYDVVFSNAVLHWIDDHCAVLDGVRQVLKPGGRLLFQMGGHGNASEFFTALNAVTDSRKWRDHFNHFISPYSFYGTGDYEQWLPQYGFSAIRVEQVPKVMRHSSRDGLKGWFRTTWFPYIDCVPDSEREKFIDQVLDAYLAANPVDSEGATSVAMVRLEVEAVSRD